MGRKEPITTIVKVYIGLMLQLLGIELAMLILLCRMEVYPSWNTAVDMLNLEYKSIWVCQTPFCEVSLIMSISFGPQKKHLVPLLAEEEPAIAQLVNHLLT